MANKNNTSLIQCNFKTHTCSVFCMSKSSSSQKVKEAGLYLLDSPHQLGKSLCWKGMSNVFASKNNHFAPICSANAAQRPKLDVCGCESEGRTCTPSKTSTMINKGETSTATGTGAPPVFCSGICPSDTGLCFQWDHLRQKPEGTEEMKRPV